MKFTIFNTKFAINITTMNNTLKFIFTLAAILCTTTLMAQGVPDDPDIQVPVDGGIFTVVGSAVAYGVYRLRNKSSK